MQCSAAILAGGRGSRLGGCPKGLIEFAPGTTVIEHLLAVCAAAGAAPQAIVTNTPQAYRDLAHPLIPDRRPGEGPLAGIESALHWAAAQTQSQTLLVLPCDMPYLEAGDLRGLLAAHATQPGRVAIAEAPPGFWQSLCVAIPVAFAKGISEALDRGERRPLRLWRALGAQPVPGPAPDRFGSINTPADLAAWHHQTPCRRRG